MTTSDLAIILSLVIGVLFIIFVVVALYVVGLAHLQHTGIEPLRVPYVGHTGTSPLQSLLLRGPGPLAKGCQLRL